MIDYFSYFLLNEIVSIPQNFYNLRSMTAKSERHSDFFVTVYFIARYCRNSNKHEANLER